MNRSKKINHRIASILATLLLLGGAVYLPSVDHESLTYHRYALSVGKYVVI